MPNPSIGEYDMVLALSESKINYEFKRLLNRGVIKPKWQFMVGPNGENIINGSHTNFEQIKKSWLGINDIEKKRLSAKKALDDKQALLKNAEGSIAAKLTSECNTLKAEIEQLDDQAGVAKKYILLMDATIDAPKMELVKDDHQQALFKLIIKSGSLYYPEGTEVKKCDLAGKIYAFRVPISQIRIDAEKMYFAGHDAIEQLREDGLSNHDFTVDSILLNFERANIARYSHIDSVLPNGDKEKAELQTAVAGYFKSLGNDKQNPYVLGYALKKKALSARDISMLYPTGTSFSTSQSNLERASAFNFLMLTGYRQFPESPFAGRIERSLIDGVQDNSATISGVIAIDYPVFEQAYLNQLHNTVVNNFDQAFKSNQDLRDFYRAYDYRGSGCTAFVFKRENMYMQMLLERRSVVEKGGIMVMYNIAVQGSVHAEIERKVFHIIKAGTVGVDQTFSTSGKYAINNKSGMEGILLITLNASNEGTLRINADYRPPTIGRDTEKPQTRDAVDAVWMVLSNFISPFGLVGGLVSLLTDNASDSIVTFKEQVFERMEFVFLDDFSNRVILPGSNVYTFKNIRLNEEPGHENCSVLFDIAYAVATD